MVTRKGPIQTSSLVILGSGYDFFGHLDCLFTGFLSFDLSSVNPWSCCFPPMVTADTAVHKGIDNWQPVQVSKSIFSQLSDDPGLIYDPEVYS